jgi:MFS family permease
MLTLIQGVVISFLGGAASFLPLVADVSHWFAKRRGLAMSICVSGNFAAGAIWPPILQWLFDAIGWRDTFIWVGLACMVAMLPLTVFVARPSPVGQSLPPAAEGASSTRPLGFTPTALQALLGFAGFCCCMAMAVPQVHIVAYCTTLGYGAVNGAHMLALMLAAGIVSRVVLGWLSDRIGGLRTLLLGSSMQAVALALYVPFDSLGSLYVISLLFGFFQGGVVPSYALIIREYFRATEAGTRTGIVLTVALFGMGMGGWLAGSIYDLTASYRNAFVLGMAANVVNIAIVVWLIARSRTGTHGSPAFA